MSWEANCLGISPPREVLLLRWIQPYNSNYKKHFYKGEQDMKFSYYMPTEIVFGCGGFDQVAGRIAQLGTRALIVTGKKAMQA